MTINNNRRSFIKQSTLSTSFLGMGFESNAFFPEKIESAPADEPNEKGAQRFPIDKLKKWEELEYLFTLG